MKLATLGLVLLLSSTAFSSESLNYDCIENSDAAPTITPMLWSEETLQLKDEVGTRIESQGYEYSFQGMYIAVLSAPLGALELDISIHDTTYGGAVRTYVCSIK